MEPDTYQQAWKAHSSQARVTIDADVLLKEVQRNERSFRIVIFWRDFREVAVALLMLPVWFYLGIALSLPWTWYLSVPALLWVAGFMLVYRTRHQQKHSRPDEPLRKCVERSLAEVESQIWLLRNVFWWYLLPPGLSISAFFVHVAWKASASWLEALGGAGVLIGFLFAVYFCVYWVNQRAVRLFLEPRRRELIALLASLSDETASKMGGA